MFTFARGASRAALRWSLPFAAALAASAAPSLAHADFIHRITLRGEGGVGTMLASFQRQDLGYDNLAIQGAFRPALTLAGPLALQVSYANWYFPSPMGAGGSQTIGGGIRLEPMLGSVARLGVDGNVGIALTGEFRRIGIDAGLSIEFQLTRWLGLGPAVRYGHVMATSADHPSDAQFWTAGLSLAVRVPEPEPAPVVVPEPVVVPQPAAPRDSDNDGVLDPDDQCVNEPQGPTPDPARRGCPARDSDNDTVVDHEDQCPSVPRGANPDPERAGCPDGDDDHDGVLNHQDQCRTQSRGLNPDPARPGCPLPDRDNDSVPDATDHCPDQPGAPHPDPNRNGCPGLVQVQDGMVRILRPVFFATNRDTILPRSYRVLQAVADGLAAVTTIRRVSIEGHTDDVGIDRVNEELSQRRANSVMAWLVAHGVAADRLEAHGFGESRPVVRVTDDMPARAANRARAQNRRVEFRIIDGGEGQGGVVGGEQPAQPAQPAAP